MQFQSSTNGVGEMINVLLQSSATGNTPINVGAAASKFANLYNVDISHTTTTNQVSTNINSTTAERLTIGGNPTAFISSGTTGLAFKDIALFGTPTTSDLRWSAAGSVLWKVYRPIWTSNAPKFSAAINSPSLANATTEYWRYDVKVVDRTGAAISGIPVRLTDVLGNIQVDTTTDSDGQVSFGSGLGANMVAVMDHYVSSGTTYAQRHRSPFTCKVNTSDLTGYNSAYLSRTYAFNWVGYASVTTSSGAFEDVGDIVAIQDPAGNPTTWVEQVVP